MLSVNDVPLAELPIHTYCNGTCILLNADKGEKWNKKPNSKIPMLTRQSRDIIKVEFG